MLELLDRLPTGRDEAPFVKRVLLIGAGGVGHLLAWTLARAGGLELHLLDDDLVELSNLHRQVLFEVEDLGQKKATALARRLAERVPGARIEAHDGRFVPATAARWVHDVDLVIDGSDNFATRFLAADACFLAGRPVVHAAAVAWRGVVMSATGGGAPCYRCVFEDLPEGEAPNCASAGVAGPLVGVVGAIGAELGLRLLAGGGPALVTVDGDALRLREIVPHARASCPLCGTRTLRELELARYLGAACASS